MKWLIAVGSILRIWLRLRPLSVIRSHLSGILSGEYRISLRGYQNPVYVRGKSSDSWVLNTVLICREYDGLIDFVPKTIIDGGANIGLASLYWNKVFPNSEIVAVEPDGGNFELAQRNLADCPSVTLLRGGLWSSQTKLRIINEGDEKYAFRVTEDPEFGGY